MLFYEDRLLNLKGKTRLSERYMGHGDRIKDACGTEEKWDCMKTRLKYQIKADQN